MASTSTNAEQQNTGGCHNSKYHLVIESYIDKPDDSEYPHDTEEQIIARLAEITRDLEEDDVLECLGDGLAYAHRRLSPVTEEVNFLYERGCRAYDKDIEDMVLPRGPPPEIIVYDSMIMPDDPVQLRSRIARAVVARVQKEESRTCLLRMLRAKSRAVRKESKDEGGVAKRASPGTPV